MSWKPWIAVLLMTAPASGTRAEAPQRVSELLSLPPAMKALVGDPLLVLDPERSRSPQEGLSGINRFKPKKGFAEGAGESRLVLRISENAKTPEVKAEAARVLAEEFYRCVLSRPSLNRHERRLHLNELFPFTEEAFVDLSVKKLTGSSGVEAWESAWWTVRTGLPQTSESRYDLVLFNLHFDHFGRKTTTGHFCFGLRRRGGAAEEDLLFDFRAPWDLDRPPRFTEGLNLHNRLLLTATVFNLYDWLHTQTEYRHCYVECWFLPVSKEQVTLLKYLSERPVVLESGQFRAFRKNCASLGQAVLHRLEPVGTPLPLGRGLADIPTVVTRRYLRDLEIEPPHFRLENVTHERGREATAKSTIHKAEPTRQTSRAFELLRAARDQ